MSFRGCRFVIERSVAVAAMLMAALSCGSPSSRVDNVVPGTGGSTGNDAGAGGLIATGGMVGAGGMVATGGTAAGTGGMAAVNVAPTVNAGADPAGQVFVGTSVALKGSASDDGLPTAPGAVSLVWSKASGPGSVAFESPSAAETKTTFGAAGAYTLRLTASDGALQAQDDVIVTVLPLGTDMNAFFKFNEGTGSTTKDEQGNLTGTLSGVSWAAGKEGSSLNCTGSTDNVVVAHESSLGLGAADFSIGIWFKTSQQAAADVYPELLFKNENLAVGYRRYEVFMHSPAGLPSIIVFKLWDGMATDSVATAVPLDGVWHHVAGRRRGKQLTIFIDGVLKTTVTGTLGSVANNGLLHFCGVGAAWANYDGQLDNVRLFARALEDAEIAALAANAL